jgi:hypothetical protein
MSDFRYLVTKLYQSGSSANPVVAEVPFTNVNFTQEINSNGNFTGEVLLGGLDTLVSSNIVNSTIPAKYALYVEYTPDGGNGVLVWGGIIWQREYDSETQILTVSGQELMSYFTRRVIYNTSGGSSGSTIFTNADPCTIANTLITNAQAVSHGNIGITGSAVTSGYSVSRTYFNYEQKNVYQAIKELSTGLDSTSQNPFFDYTITPVYTGSGSSTKITKYFTMGAPYLGNGSYDPTNALTAHVFDFPGNIVSYTYPEDGTTTANKIYGLGYGANLNKLIAIAQDPSKISGSGDWPLLESTANFVDISNTNFLKAVTVGQVNAISYPPTAVKVVLPSYINPQYNTYKIGDFARLSIFDDFFSNGTTSVTSQEVYRITSIEVTPGENGPDRVTLTLTLPLATTGTVA